MQGYNCIMVFSKDEDKLLFCKRKSDPYQGLYNFVGGKIIPGEDGYEAAYRELKEETGITKQDLLLSHMMDFTYYNQDCYVEVYVGTLEHDVQLREEKHPLFWLEMTEDFYNNRRFAGEGNIGHMVEQVRIYGTGKPYEGNNRMDRQSLSVKTSVNHEAGNITDALCIGVDGCKGGWIAAVLDHGTLKIERYASIDYIVDTYPDFQEFLIDMVIGLAGKREHVRPDNFARGIIKERTSTIFPAPCRQAIYAKNIAEAYDENVRVLGKKFTPLTVGIFPKIREMDEFLQKNEGYKNVIRESHPEVCFARLNGRTVMSKKSDPEGMYERIQILNQYIPDLALNKISLAAKNYRCNVDDIIDAICLAVTANLAEQGLCEAIPANPMKDDTGLYMQMVIPKKIY